MSGVSTNAEYITEVPVNDLMNVVYNNESGEYVYLVQLEDENGEIIGTTEQALTEYMVFKTDEDEGIPEHETIREITLEQEVQNGVVNHHIESNNTATDFEQEYELAEYEPTSSQEEEYVDHETQIQGFEDRGSVAQENGGIELQYYSESTCEDYNPEEGSVTEEYDEMKIETEVPLTLSDHYQEMDPEHYQSGETSVEEYNLKIEAPDDVEEEEEKPEIGDYEIGGSGGKESKELETEVKDEVQEAEEVNEQHILVEVKEEQEEDIKVEENEMDYEQVSAAANLLEFHNQQPVTVVAPELFETLAASDDFVQCEFEDIKPMIAGEGLEIGHMKSDFGEMRHSTIFSGISKTYGKNSMSTGKFQNGTSNVSHPTLPVKRAKNDIFILPTPGTRRRRRIVSDRIKVISNSEFRQQLQDTSDIVCKLVVAPRTKKAMSRLAYEGVGKYFAYPGRRVQSMPLAQLFFSHLTMKVEPQQTESRTEVKPLDPNLITPASSLFLNSMQSGSHECMETAIKRTVDSFDMIVKGMNASKARKREKTRQILATNIFE